MSHTPIFILGLGLPVRSADGRRTYPTLAHPVLEGADVIVGREEQLEAVKDHPAEKLPIRASSLEQLFAGMERNMTAGRCQVVLNTGDPLFFGMGATLVRRLGQDCVQTIPALSSMQASASLCGLPWDKMRHVTLHGRTDWTPLAHALLAGGPVCILTDKNSPPSAIAAFMLERGRAAYLMHCLKDLYIDGETGLIRAESRLALSPDDALSHRIPDNGQTTVILEPLSGWASCAFGLADELFDREGRLITKTPVRAAALHALGILPQNTVWDLGAGSGAVGIEASRLAHQGRVLCVERDPNRIGQIKANRKIFGAANLDVLEGFMPDCLMGANLPRPDRIFLGGGLGVDAARATSLVDAVWNELAPGGKLVAACVLLASLEKARTSLARLGAAVEVMQIQAALSTSLAGDIRLEAQNPVFLVTASKENGNVRY